MMNHTLKLLAFSTALAVAAPAAASGSFFDGHHRKLYKELNLTEAQKAQVQEIKKKTKDSMKEHRAKIKEAMADLSKSLKNPTKGDSYRQELKNKFNEVQNLRNEMMARRFDTALEIREILTPEQIQKFQAMDHGMKKGGRHGKKRGWMDQDDKDGG